MNKTLLLIDHDGTLCQTSNTAFDSIKYAAQVACQKVGSDFNQLSLDWDKIFFETAGTTEKNLARHLAFSIDIPMKSFDNFEKEFYNARAQWYKSMKSHQEFIFDTYYPDVELLVSKAVENKNFLIMLVTGNPKVVANERLSDHIKNFFSKNGELIGSFGEEGLERSELILNAIKKVQILFPDFNPKKASNGFFENVYYVADSKKDFVSAIKSKVKVIWVPSRTLQSVKEVFSNEFLKILVELLNGFVVVTNNVSSKEVFDFLKIK